MTPAAHAVHAGAVINDLQVTLDKVIAARDCFAADATALADWANRQSAENAELSAENEKLRGEVARWRSAASEAAGNLAELVALASEVLDDVKRPGDVPADAALWQVVIFSATFDRWMKVAEPLGIEAL